MGIPCLYQASHSPPRPSPATLPLTPALSLILWTAMGGRQVPKETMSSSLLDPFLRALS